ncbi:murein DD-endopeptidase MepM/ murein hydrolase activator NlpD [Frigoribacterium sp. PvP120]|jgi:murein DD-endopeptidase MepM/ murein hydrolase activator NlpD|uniref:M23 family metallopeptidase n=1 Tax=unclassified Frigoribacterium TaxID=2627005 RepID=UPI001AE6A16D|nr:M23 family metallopeptidase [Frigoribacterium sp. PvP121]MBP1240226.1 murein DD-endopeptidase MepM/ murein hydrolase activator NlpD [Frigoribacterium sp. PvP121]
MIQISPRRLRARRRPVMSGDRRAVRLALVVAALSLVVTGGVMAVPAPARAADYPSWEDVQAAQGDANAKAAEIVVVQGLLEQLQTDLDTKNADAVTKGTAYEEAQTAYDQAEFKLGQLQDQADAADAVAAASEERAGQLAAQLGRSSGGNDISSSLIADPGDAGQLLYRIGAMSKLTEQADGIYSQATQDRNTAQSLSDQADVAAAALKVLAAEAEDALAAANEAAQAAADAFDEQETNRYALEAQLAVLQSDLTTTKEEFEKGEAERKAAEAAAAAEAARLGSPTNGTPTGVVSSSGWTRPSGGNISSGFGMRVNPVTHAYILHAGTDLAAACGTPIFAATSGTVSYAGWYGGYGNFVLLDNGGGVTTGYGHQPNGGITVSVGQHVEVGQQIGHVGSTGNSTGCHLHFETRVGGTPQNPVDFMAQRGIRL